MSNFSQSVLRGQVYLRLVTLSLVVVSTCLSSFAVTQPAGKLRAVPGTVQFGRVVVGQSSQASCIISNTGTAPVTISKVVPGNPAVVLSSPALPLVLSPGANAVLTFTFTPKNASSLQARIAVGSTASPEPTIELRGRGLPPGALSVQPSSVDFGAVSPASSAANGVRVKNIGFSDVHISGAQVIGNGFTVTGSQFPMTLAPAQSVTLNVLFTPATGQASGRLTIESDAAGPKAVVSLSGTLDPPGALTINPRTVVFGGVGIGKTKKVRVLLTADRGKVVISSLGTSTSEFTLSAVHLPLQIAAGKSRPLMVGFAPEANGQATGSLLLTSDAANSPVVILRGAGTGYRVLLSWTGSTSPVTGYDVYRSSRQGGPYKILNSTPNPDTSFIDTTVKTGQTYYYVVTSVDSAGVQSAFSGEVPAVVP